MARKGRNGSDCLTINEVINLFYRSRYNHDPLCDFEEDEDIDDSTRHRLYNKRDIADIMKLFWKFFEELITSNNISKVYLTDKIKFTREIKLPKLKPANFVDSLRKYGSVEEGETYITRGKYSWLLWMDMDLMDKLHDMLVKDPEYIAAYEQKKKELEERKKNAENVKHKAKGE